jgi:hypothetical protein
MRDEVTGAKLNLMVESSLIPHPSSLNRYASQRNQIAVIAFIWRKPTKSCS